SVAWDGKTDAGAAAADGAYAVRLDAADAAGNHAVQQSAAVVVDARKPLSLVSPAAGALLAGPVTFVFSQPADYNLPYYAPQALRSEERRVGKEYRAHLARQADGTWAVTSDARAAVNGAYEPRTDVYQYLDRP